MKNVEAALSMLGRTNVADRASADRLIRGARKEVAEAEKVRKANLDMFRSRQLDAYPTSDAAPEYALKKWCGYEEKESDT